MPPLFRLLLLSLAVSLVARGDAALPALPVAPVQIAAAGEAQLAITIAPKASAVTRQAAADLAAMLKRITGATFAVQAGGEPGGITVGSCLDYPQLAPLGRFQPDEPFRKDAYLLRSHADGLYLIGASDVAVQHAVWDLLHRVGYRLYFLTDTWEIVPTEPNLSVQLDVFEQPDYVTRAAPRGSPWSNGELWDRWRIRNRVVGAFTLNTGHSYDGIISRHETTFKEHREYLALVQGKRTGNKFCIANPALRTLVVNDAITQIQKNPDRDSVSLDPSDGGGWCECQPCADMGSVSDRVVLLANQAAIAINELGLGTKYVGIYGYADHSIPPNVDVHPNVVVSLATAFIRGGNSIDSMVAGWSDHGAVIGIREYHDVFTWSHDLPHRARGGNIPYLVRTIPHFYAHNARFMNSECSDSWAANGLAFWLTPRLLWETDQAEHVDALFEDFLTRCFGQAKEPMREFYERINFRKYAFKTVEDDLANYFRLLQQAMALTDDPQQLARLEDLILYVRYHELYNTYRGASLARPDSSEAINFKDVDSLEDSAAVAPGVSNRQLAYNDLSIHVLRMADRYMLSTRAIVDRDRYRDDTVAPYSLYAAARKPDEGSLDVLELEPAAEPSTVPFTREEIMGMLSAGVAAHQPVVLNFEPVEYSAELVATVAVKPDADGTYRLGDSPTRLVGRGERQFLLWIDEPGTIEIGITGGLIAHYRDRGNVRVALYSPQNELTSPVAEDASTPPDGKERIVRLTTTFTGLHTLQVRDGHDKTSVALPTGVPVTINSGMPNGRGLSTYFYVPKGTKILGGFSRDQSGQVLAGDGSRVYAFADMEANGYFSFPVPAGQDGSYWQLVDCRGVRTLMTVPPYLAASPGALLLPREVVEADAPTPPTPPEP